MRPSGLRSHITLNMPHWITIKPCALYTGHNPTQCFRGNLYTDEFSSIRVSYIGTTDVETNIIQHITVDNPVRDSTEVLLSEREQISITLAPISYLQVWAWELLVVI